MEQLIFVVGHYATEAEATAIAQQYCAGNIDVLLCGSTSVALPIRKDLPYHPLFFLEATDSTVAQQHSFIDSMCRAIQILVPNEVVVVGATMLDTYTVWQRIAEHAAIVGVPIRYKS